MDVKMQRFLKSLGLDEAEYFDLSFDDIARNPFKPEQWDMIIHKPTPWKYDLLRQFQDGLGRITYPYKLSFSYSQKAAQKDVIRLFDDWYQTLYRIPHNLVLEEGENAIVIWYEKEAEIEQYKESMRDFQDFLRFIGYVAFFDHRIKPTEEEIKLNPKVLKKITKEVEKTLTPDFESIELDVEKEHRENVREAEEALAKEMEENLRRMEMERQNRVIFKRGDYQPYSIGEFDTNSGNVDFTGTVFSREERKTQKGKMIFTLGVDDHKNGIYVRAIEDNRALTLEKLNQFTVNSKIRVRGAVGIDKFSNELFVMAHFLDLLPVEPLRDDPSPEKRIELHLHTKMSSMDGVGTIEDYCALAAHMGHTAIAITDHGVVQGFPDAQKAASKFKLKMLYGVEMYMVDDCLNYIQNPSNQILTKASYVVFDFETTGLSARYDRIIEFGAVKVIGGIVTDHMDILINPGDEVEISPKITQLTRITKAMLKGQPSVPEALEMIEKFVGDSILVSHNADFDIGFMNSERQRYGKAPITNSVIDTLSLSRYLFPEAKGHRLGNLARNLEIAYDEDSAHRADYDAKVLNDVWQPMLAILTKGNQEMKHRELADLPMSPILLKHLRAKHIVVFARNAVGMKDLFRLISLSHIEYLADVPKIPRSEIIKYRSNLLIGSACFNGEVFDTAMTRTKEVLLDKMKFYDYIEIQHTDNYSYLIDMDSVNGQDGLVRFLTDIIEAADELHLPVVATGDCHYVNPEDKIYRDVYIMAKGIGGINHPLFPFSRADRPVFENPDQHYRSTSEMLANFAWLGPDRAKEIVITNTHLIADKIEPLSPIKNKLFTPTIENVENLLTDTCHKRAHEIYGENLPPLVATRLDAELNGIIKNGYSVIYWIAHMIIKKANEDGFMVGSRGSVGSSFVATMADITEVNPLPPHYNCPKCHYTEFTDLPDIFSGYDLPEKKCPVCGADLRHDGQNIPFATFLGFNAEKVPDIDLNFPGDYQARAHDYTKELLGAQNVFRAGTIETVAEKTAFGYARGFYERLGRDMAKVSRADVSFLATHCQDVKRTTGQHPGGIVVIPQNFEVYDFTPIQYPADDKDANWKTTHFDFHAIHDNVLKLDLLGHVDPMALKMMEQMTGVDPRTIPMNDAKVLSLFSNPSALNRKRNYLKIDSGALAIPEFGTENTRNMLRSTQPKTFADLLIISGLSHGTDVWRGNAEQLILDGTCTLREVIGCRDDIMTYLSGKGLPPNIAFAIMEDVRKGKKVKPEFEKIMKANNVPQYYIDSCNKIKYMFPKAHATAYVMMAIRVGWYKVYRPLEFYATFFSVRSKQYDIEVMIRGEAAIIEKLDEFRDRRSHKLKVSDKEEEIEKTLTIALEMHERGYKFTNIDLYRSQASTFIVDSTANAIIPPFTSIDGLGENAANSVIEARKEGKFLSKENLLKRTKLNGTNVEVLGQLNVLRDLEETDQMSLFSFNFEEDDIK